jgi:uncharacterized membrane protein HdeD (DUF308 family)
MIDNPQRVEEFKADVAAMHVADPATSRDRKFLAVGVVLMLAGPIIALASYFAAEPRDVTTFGLTGVAVGVIGAALFLRYSIAQFLRFWLARQIYEQRALNDKLIESLRGKA